MQCYIITLAAGRQVGGLNFELGASTVLTIQGSQQEAEQQALNELQSKYPASAGWRSHQHTVFALPSAMETDGYRLVSTIEKA